MYPHFIYESFNPTYVKTYLNDFLFFPYLSLPLSAVVHRMAGFFKRDLDVFYQDLLGSLHQRISNTFESQATFQS